MQCRIMTNVKRNISNPIIPYTSYPICQKCSLMLMASKTFLLPQLPNVPVLILTFLLSLDKGQHGYSDQSTVSHPYAARQDKPCVPTPFYNGQL